MVWLGLLTQQSIKRYQWRHALALTGTMTCVHSYVGILLHISQCKYPHRFFWKSLLTPLDPNNIQGNNFYSCIKTIYIQFYYKVQKSDKKYDGMVISENREKNSCHGWKLTQFWLTNIITDSLWHMHLHLILTLLLICYWQLKLESLFLVQC